MAAAAAGAGSAGLSSTRPAIGISSATLSASEAFVAPEECDDECRAVVETLARTGVPVIELGSEPFARLAYGDRRDGIVPVAEAPPRRLADLRLPEHPLVGVVESTGKPGNLGTILCTADGAGVSALIVAGSHTDLFNPNVIRASIGTVFSVPLALGPTSDVIAWLRERQLRIVAARVDAELEYAEATLRGPIAIVLGSEAHGLSEAWTVAADIAVKVPMRGVADSLNVSVSAAILLYEAVRQRGNA